MKQWKDNN